MTEDNGYVRERVQCAEIDLLPNRRVRVSTVAADLRRKIFDFDDVIVRQNRLAEFSKIEPLVPGLSKGTVVEIKAVNVDVCL